MKKILLVIGFCGSFYLQSAEQRHACQTKEVSIQHLIDNNKIPAFFVSNSDSKKTLDLSDKEITYFDGLKNLPNNIESLELDENNFRIIKKDAFVGLPLLKKLHISENEIPSGESLTIEKGAFTGLGALERLYLSESNISYIEEGAFTGLISLGLLDLDYNTALTQEQIDRIIREFKTISPSVYISFKHTNELNLHPCAGSSTLPKTCKGWSCSDLE